MNYTSYLLDVNLYCIVLSESRRYSACDKNATLLTSFSCDTVAIFVPEDL